MFELFKIGFISVTLIDIIDIALVSILVYKLYDFMKGTIAGQIFWGLVIVLILSFITQAIDLKALGWLLTLVRDIWVIAFIILFQPEIRKLLVSLGRNPIVKSFQKKSENVVINEIVDASFELAQHQHGALMVIVKSSGIAGIAETGDLINARITKDLLRSIFFPRSPLHDGAAILKGDLVESVRCTLPLSTVTEIDGETLGMRHRAGLGITEQADVISIIVSEETGSIAVAENGKLTRGLSKDMLTKYLYAKLSTKTEKKIQNFLNIFNRKNN